MTLGNRRELGVYHLIGCCQWGFEYEPARNTRVEDVGRNGARLYVYALLD